MTTKERKKPKILTTMADFEPEVIFDSFEVWKHWEPLEAVDSFLKAAGKLGTW